MLTMTACGMISPPIQNAVTETTMVSADSLADSSVLSESDSNTMRNRSEQIHLLLNFSIQVSALQIRANC